MLIFGSCLWHLYAIYSVNCWSWGLWSWLTADRLTLASLGKHAIEIDPRTPWHKPLMFTFSIEPMPCVTVLSLSQIDKRTQTSREHRQTGLSLLLFGVFTTLPSWPVFSRKPGVCFWTFGASHSLTGLRPFIHTQLPWKMAQATPPQNKPAVYNHGLLGGRANYTSLLRTVQWITPGTIM